MEARIGRQKIELPNQDGVYNTQLGQIGVSIIDQQPNGEIRKIALEGEVMKGTPLKNRHKRNPRKIVSLNEDGNGAQTLSKRETVHVDLYTIRIEDHLRDLRILFGDEGY